MLWHRLVVASRARAVGGQRKTTYLRPTTLGRRGEARAAWYYRLRGYRILERNLKLGRGEIDLVVRRGRSVAFVEVKTRQQTRTGEGFTAVDDFKEAQLAALADRYLARHDLSDCRIRFDVMSLYWTGRRFRITCYRDAFQVEADPQFPWRNKKGFRSRNPGW